MRRTAFSSVLLLLTIGCNDGIGPPLSSLSFVTTDITLSSLGENYQLKLSAKTAQGEDFKNPKITWTSTDPGVATVSEIRKCGRWKLPSRRFPNVLLEL